MSPSVCEANRGSPRSSAGRGADIIRKDYFPHKNATLNPKLVSKSDTICSHIRHMINKLQTFSSFIFAKLT